MSQRYLQAAVIGLALAAWTLPSGPASADGIRRIARTRAPVARVSERHQAVFRQCNRALVRDCQADASVGQVICEQFGDRLACAARELAELRACWAGTGCF